MKPTMRAPRQSSPATDGYILVAVLVTLMILTALAMVYMTVTLQNKRDTVNVSRSTKGYYAAEGGLNLRAEQLVGVFKATNNNPSGTSPTGNNPCVGANQGSGDLKCNFDLNLSDRTVTTYVVDRTVYDSSGFPTQGQVNPGEKFEGLNYQQYAYRVISEANLPGKEGVEAKTEMEFQIRLIPMFQFAAFYKKDLEIAPGPAMTLRGRVHTNSNLYLSSGNTLAINGQVSAQTLYRGRKDTTGCSGTVQIADMSNTLKNLTGCSGGTASIDATALKPFGNRINVPGMTLDIPEPSKLDPSGSNELFRDADLRFVANKSAPNAISVVNASGNVETIATNYLKDKCPGAVGISETLYDKRDQETKRLIDVDQTALMNCVYSAPGGTFPVKLDDSSGGGLVFHFSFGSLLDDFNKTEIDTSNLTKQKWTNYGVRIKNAKVLGSSVSGAPSIKGLTIVTNQPAYVQGDFNKDESSNWKPAAVIADSVNILSNSWDDKNSEYAPMKAGGIPVPALATETEVNAAFLAGVDQTTSGKYNGGLENYPRFHESWGGVKFRYRGSFVSLGESAHAKGKWPGTCSVAYNDKPVKKAGCVYDAPVRDWDYDSRFNNAKLLPPLSPRFTYKRLLRFGRTY